MLEHSIPSILDDEYGTKESCYELATMNLWNQLSVSHYDNFFNTKFSYYLP